MITKTVTERVKNLLAFHDTCNFGSGENLRACHMEAKRTYLSLTPAEESELATAVISMIEGGNDADGPLRYLACFRPGSLSSIHERLVELRILRPGVIFYGAESRIAHQLIPLCENDTYRNHTLVALAWIGDNLVQQVFASWRDRVPDWSSRLHCPPHQYTEEAGWELSPEGKRRNLYTTLAYPLARSETARQTKSGLGVGARSKKKCPWCGRFLLELLAFDDISAFVPNQPRKRLSVLTCDVCTCYGPIFAKCDSSGVANWHDANVKPSYLPEDTSDWIAFPDNPLVVTGNTRHFLESADWLVLGVSFSQVGGVPTWIQYADYPTCPECSRKMPFVGQISNEDFMDGEGIYYAFYCPMCNVSGTAYQQS